VNRGGERASKSSGRRQSSSTRDWLITKYALFPVTMPRVVSPARVQGPEVIVDFQLLVGVQDNLARLTEALDA